MGCTISSAQEATSSHCEHAFWVAATLERIVFGLVLHCSRGLVMAIKRPVSLLTIQILTRSYRHVYFI